MLWLLRTRSIDLQSGTCRSERCATRPNDTGEERIVDHQM